jgi:hypothetical protein
MGRLRYAHLLLTLMLGCSTLGPTPVAQPGLGASRLRPPASLQCPRDHLTAFSGEVTSFQRGADRVVLHLRTDDAGTKQITLDYPEGSDLTQWFLLKGEAFRPEDWEQVESPQQRLREHMRAVVWVCDDGTNPIIDWQPRPH